MTQVLVVNSGSSSVKYQVIDLPSEQVVDKGQRDRVGIDGGDFATHKEAIADIVASLPANVSLDLVGHRVVHGGARFTRPVLIDQDVISGIEKVRALAPLHNPANLEGIHAVTEVMPQLPQVAVFDTAFFSTLSPAAYDYALPRDLVEKYGIRKYGFHGTSHDYVTGELSRLMPPSEKPVRVVSFHLGNGSSVAAVRGGVAVDTSMGLTPLAGLVMGTRSGDIDPSVVLYLQREAGLSPEQVDEVLNRNSGLLGLSGHSDMRDLYEHAEHGDPDALHALDVWTWRAKHYLGAYLAQLGGLDAIVFTGGIGENSPELRLSAVSDLEGLGIHIDESRNKAESGEPRLISADGSSVSLWVIPTNEELHIARIATRHCESARKKTDLRP
ncbi:acetate kinase [Pontimonas salivibrio]|uniref:Acetate kinase n=1 Tax=Pontimonas salivibrio TaxID=1159327 RepID=A0A2L2BSL6_9MICO|nr:acetate kinase [Pontimonas salivibrio]AVG24665.1 acetate kinase [Pontimonas salivibrio]